MSTSFRTQATSEDGDDDTQTLSVEIDDDAQDGWQGSDDDGDIVRNWCPS